MWGVEVGNSERKLVKACLLIGDEENRTHNHNDCAEDLFLSIRYHYFFARIVVNLPKQDFQKKLAIDIFPTREISNRLNFVDGNFRDEITKKRRLKKGEL